MDQVSNFFENILAVEPNETDPSTKGKSILNELKQSKPMAEKLKRKSESDFAFWTHKKEGNDEPKSTNTLLTDKLMEKIISMVIPMNVKDQGALNERLEMQKTRPPLSVNLISKNSILLNLRLSVPFETIDSVIKFFNWDNLTFTVGVLLVITHIILNPYLILVLPLFQILFSVMVPHYLVLHPTDRSMLNSRYYQRNPIPDDGPALHESVIPKPVPELSNEFVLNLTDLQNHMLLYVVTYDLILWATNGLLFYKDENISSVVFLGLLILGVHNLFVLPKVLPILFSYLPIKLMLVISIWTATIMFHPIIRNILLNWMYNEETRLYFVKLNSQVEEFLLNLIVKVGEEQVNIETKQVEIFELQRYDQSSKIWELNGFTNDFYTINSPMRKLKQEYLKVKDNDANEDDESTEKSEPVDIHTTPSINAVKPPIDWEFNEESWKLDLDVNNWVDSNLLADLVMIDTDEKWVYDLESSTTPESFRRRRWVRTCKRRSTIKDTNQSNSGSAYSDYLL
mmetsp:Transcript_1506/g.1502  ORF Transcript_1506/g.1502 Transcript_1506/m.1502 type:complete len:512 (-) Transcript_1506:16-1551(-)